MLFIETFAASVSVAISVVRTLFIVLDRAAFGILELVYQLFFNVASATIFSGATIAKLYGRIQLIIGVYMMFQLALIILRGIVNPESFTDKKTGFSNFITRVITALVLLTMLVPISVPKSTDNMNEFEKQINNNGLLFGTLYSLQYRLLRENTIARIILGSTISKNYKVEQEEGQENSDGEDNLLSAGKVFTRELVKSFYRINLIPYDERTKHHPSGEDGVYPENRICEDMGDSMEIYASENSTAGDIFDLADETCSLSGTKRFGWFGKQVRTLMGKERYMFVTMPVVSLVVAIVFIFMFVSFTIDVAIRAIKLAVLRLIAPIPIISYMDPKGSKDSAFNSWVKILSSTYLDLFIRLASVYFVLFIIQEMIDNGTGFGATGSLRGLSRVAIWIGLLSFAKQAPKFIKQALGMKDEGEGKGIFSGLGSALAIGAAAGGMVGSGIASYRASKAADETRAALGMKTFLGGSKAKHILSGITGGIAGGVTGANAGLSAKDHHFRNTMEAMRKRNAEALAKGEDGSTMFGRLGSSAHGLFTGETSGQSKEREDAKLESKQKALDAIKSRVSGEMVKMDWTSGAAKDGFEGYAGAGTTGTKVSMDGKKINYKQFVANMAESQASGKDYVVFNDASGNQFTVSYSDAEMMKGQILQSNEDDYIAKVTGGLQSDMELMSLVRDAEKIGAAGSSYDEIKDEHGRVIYKRKVSGRITSRADYTKVKDKMAQEQRVLKRQNAVNKANDRYSSKK